MSTWLSAERRARELDSLADGDEIDLLVIGGGVTGAGAALDAAARGLSVALVERGDLAQGTSRWSSKLVHGGLRYLAKGRFGLAWESARERDALMRVIAPHLVRTLPMVMPLHAEVGRPQALLTRAGMGMGDVLRRAAGTGSDTLPRTRRLTAAQTTRLLPGVRTEGLRGGILSFDGQLTDDARLVVAIARTAAGHGARIITRCAAERAGGRGAVLRDEPTGRRFEVRARSVLNATGVHAGALDPEVRLRPSRGTHLVLRAQALGRPATAVTVPVPGTIDRYVFALPQDDGRVYAGLTDAPVDGPLPDVPEAPESDIAYLLETVGTVLGARLDRSDVVGAFAGLRPLLDAGGGEAADLSRRHAVLRSTDGLITVVGGKLTTYRLMAEQAVDAAVAGSGITARPCATSTLPLVGAAAPGVLDAIDAPRRLVTRYGTEAPDVLSLSAADSALGAPIAAGVTPAEFLFALQREMALHSDDLLDRRTRIGLVAPDRAAALPWAAEALRRTSG